MATVSRELEKQLADVRRLTDLPRPFQSLSEAVVLSLLVTEKRIDLLADAFFRRFRVSPAGFNVLMCLYDHRPQGCRQNELTEWMVVHRSSMAELLRKLRKAGLVSATADIKNRRVNVVRLTSKGKSWLLPVRKQYYKLVANAFREISAKDQKTLIQLLGKVRETVEALSMDVGGFPV